MKYTQNRFPIDTVLIERTTMTAVTHSALYASILYYTCKLNFLWFLNKTSLCVFPSHSHWTSIEYGFVRTGERNGKTKKKKKQLPFDLKSHYTPYTLSFCVVEHSMFILALPPPPPPPPPRLRAAAAAAVKVNSIKMKMMFRLKCKHTINFRSIH